MIRVEGTGWGEIDFDTSGRDFGSRVLIRAAFVRKQIIGETGRAAYSFLLPSRTRATRGEGVSCRKW